MGSRDPDPVGTVRAAQQTAAGWPYRELDLNAVRATGWRPTPLREFVLKVHQRCNLACDYCYVYTQPDQSWRDRPAAMPQPVWGAAVAAIGRYAGRHRLTEVRIVLHGGEPLLFGADRLARLVEQVRAELPAGCVARIGLQTNGLLLTQATLDRLRPHRVAIGVSLDGPPQWHDRHRVDRRGRGSSAGVQAALELLCQPENRGSYAGILATVAPDSDPVACYDALVSYHPPAIDLLLPHANWQRPPQRPADRPTAHGDWLCAVFDRWYGQPAAPRVRLFTDVLALLLGGHSESEQVGLSPSGTVVIESDGAVEQVDALKSAYPGACATGLDVRRDELDAVLEDPGMAARQLGVAALSDECLACPVHRVCGAGHYAHRYRPGTGFRHPSVYCADLRRLIDHATDRLTADLRERAAARAASPDASSTGSAPTDADPVGRPADAVIGGLS